MARSVARPTSPGSVCVFLRFSIDTDDHDDYHHEYDYILDDIKDALRARFPSLEPPHQERWVDRELSVLLENRHVTVTVSKYCGLSCVAMFPDEDNPLSMAWCSRAEPTFRKIFQDLYPGACLVPIGFASNGEQFFRPLNRPSDIVTPKEGVLW